jgi:hypothetical protein
MAGEQGDSRRDNLACRQIGFKPPTKPLMLQCIIANNHSLGLLKRDMW